MSGTNKASREETPNMKTTKKHSSRDDQPMQRIVKERELIDHIRSENEFLKLDLNRESRDARRSTSTGVTTDIARLQEEGARYIRKIEQERKKVEQLEGEIIKYQEKILEQKARLGGINAAQINNQLIQKQIRQLENRIDKNLTKFNEIIAENKVLRQKIDDYRRERVIFDGIYKKLERELHEKKKEMAAIIEESKTAYLARDKSQMEMDALYSHADKEKSEFEAEFKELGELIKQQQHMLQQMRLKQFDKAQEKLKNLTYSTDERISDLETPIGALYGNKDKNAPLSQEKIFSYEDAIRKIQESTGIYDINEIVTRFLEAEEQNFSLFNYVNDINSEIERLEHAISEMRNQIEKYRGQGMSTDTQRKKTIRDLEEKLSKTDRKADEYEARHQEAARTITQLKNGIHSIFTRIGAASSSVDEMLGNQGVTESNMMQYLGLIEQRTAEILHDYASNQNSNNNNNESTLQLPTVIPMETPSKLQVPLPSYDEMSSGEDSEGEQDERPLTRHELEKRTIKEISKKTATN